MLFAHNLPVTTTAINEFLFSNTAPVVAAATTTATAAVPTAAAPTNFITIPEVAETMAATTVRYDGTAFIPIDSLNNNHNNGGYPKQQLQHQPHPIHFETVAEITPFGGAGANNNNRKGSSGSNNNNNNNNGGDSAATDNNGGRPPATSKRRSLLSFKSFDFNIKSLYNGFRNGHNKSGTQSRSASLGGETSHGMNTTNGGCSSSVNADTPTGTSTSTGTTIATTTATSSGGTRPPFNRTPPYLKIEIVDADESETLLIDYAQSPYSSRRNSSQDVERCSSSQLLNISPSPYFLSPYSTGASYYGGTTLSPFGAVGGGGGSCAGNVGAASSASAGNIRRSSTSDIVSVKRSGASSASDSRRPSTSDLLRRARERRGSEARMGRSVSHSGLPRGGRGGGAGGGSGRRTSIAC